MKKLTAGIFTVLMGLVSVNAADAAVASQGYVDFKVGENTTAIDGLSRTVQANKEAADAVAGRVTTAEGKITAAEGKITTLETDVGTLKTQVADETTGLIKKVTELKTQIDDVSEGNLTIKNGAINTDQLADNSVTEIKLANNSVTEAKLATDLANKINAAQTATQVGSAIDTKINELNLAETYEALNNKTQSVNEGSTEDQYPSAKAVYTAVSTLQNGAVKNNADAIEAINNETTGILALAKSYADGKASTAQAGAEATAASALSTAKTELTTEINKKANSADVYTKTEADNAFMTSDEVEGKIEAAVAENGAVKTVVDTAVSTLKNGAVKDNADAIKAIQESEYANSGISAEKVSAYDAYDTAIKANATAAANAAAAASTAESNAKTYALGKANAALTASVKYTDDYITSLGLQQIASVPVDCSNDTNYCTLTANADGFAWEVIARVEGETVEGRTAVTSEATAKPAAPAALTE